MRSSPARSCLLFEELSSPVELPVFGALGGSGGPDWASPLGLALARGVAWLTALTESCSLVSCRGDCESDDEIATTVKIAETSSVGAPATLGVGAVSTATGRPATAVLVASPGRTALTETCSPAPCRGVCESGDEEATTVKTTETSSVVVPATSGVGAASTETGRPAAAVLVSPPLAEVYTPPFM